MRQRRTRSQAIADALETQLRCDIILARWCYRSHACLLRSSSTLSVVLFFSSRNSKKKSRIIIFYKKVKSRLTRIVKCFNDDSSEPIPKYDREMEEFVREVLEGRKDEEIVAEIGVSFVSKRNLKTLEGLKWLDGEVINTYLQLIQRRSTNSSTLPRSYCFNTFLYDKVSKIGHSAVKRWTRKVNIFDYDLVFFPIHLGNHWTLAYADIRKKTLRYCDSMGGKNPKCLAALFDYLKIESVEKTKRALDDDWKTESISGKIPQQQNTNDCGVFSCVFADYISRDAAFNFSQADMPNLRNLVKYELLKGKMLKE
ncbi:unnamed protein product [Oikopleura dioica]|uniref:Ubiquitin-like protease family profile domain-containing protein n=1 Tax=Oikopleura dioica TaxID=34765 RepID=E4XQ70_OIKDI|nr:unnamed protein product [Oikopleura dioica]